MRIYAGESSLEEVEVGRNLGYAGDMIDEDFDRSKNLSWDQFQRLLDTIGSDATEDTFVDEIVDYIFENAEIEEWEDWDEDGHYGGADQIFDWEWEKDGFFYHVKGKVYGNVDSDPGDYFNPPYYDAELTSVSIDVAEVALTDENIEAFEDREDWDDNGEMEQWYDLSVDISDSKIETKFEEEAKRR